MTGRDARGLVGKTFVAIGAVALSLLLPLQLGRAGIRAVGRDGRHPLHGAAVATVRMSRRDPRVHHSCAGIKRPTLVRPSPRVPRPHL